MLQSGEKYENYHGPERTCLCSRYHAIYGRDTTDQNEHVFAVYIIQFTVVIPRTRTNMFVQYMFCNYKMYKGTTIRRAAFSRKLRERVLLKNSCSIDHQHDKTIADHQPLTTANDKTIADHQPLTTANDKNDTTIADHQPLTTANDKTMRRSAEKIC